MKALVVTITREPWPANLTRHWHLVDSHLSRHVVGAVQNVYGRFARIEEVDATECPECGYSFIEGGTDGQG